MSLHYIIVLKLHSFVYMLFLVCFGLCWAIIREFIHVQRWILLLALYLYHVSADKKYTSFCVSAKSMFAQCLGLAMRCIYVSQE